MLWPDIFPIFMVIKQAHMITKIEKIRHLLLVEIPEEFYDIEPGHVFYFVPSKGLNITDVNLIQRTYYYLMELHKDSDLQFSIVPTDYNILVDSFVGRSPREVGKPYKVIASTVETIAGFISQYYDEDLEKLMATPVSFSIIRDMPKRTADSPVVVSIDPENRPIKKSADIGGDIPDDFGLGWLKRQPETDKEKEEMVANREQKIKKILWECVYLGIDLDIKSIADEVEACKSETSDYELSLKMEPDEKSGLIDCKIYVKEDKELVLTPIRKAVYLTFLSLKDGQVIESATPAFTQRIQKIYKLLPDKERKDEEENGARGILAAQYIQSKTLRGYMSEINATIAKLIPNGLAAIEFSIEGEKEGAFKVMRSTPEIRKQIITAFSL